MLCSGYDSPQSKGDLRCGDLKTLVCGFLFCFLFFGLVIFRLFIYLFYLRGDMFFFSPAAW